MKELKGIYVEKIVDDIDYFDMRNRDDYSIDEYLLDEGTENYLPIIKMEGSIRGWTC